MRQINVRQFLRGFKEEIKNLPVEVNQYGQTIFVAFPAEESELEERQGKDANFKKAKGLDTKGDITSTKSEPLTKERIVKAMAVAGALEEIRETRPLGWCEKIVNGRRCTHNATVETLGGKFCEEHK